MSKAQLSLMPPSAIFFLLMLICGIVPLRSAAAAQEEGKLTIYQDPNSFPPSGTVLHCPEGFSASMSGNDRCGSYVECLHNELPSAKDSFAAVVDGKLWGALCGYCWSFKLAAWEGYYAFTTSHAGEPNVIIDKHAPISTAFDQEGHFKAECANDKIFQQLPSRVEQLDSAYHEICPPPPTGNTPRQIEYCNAGPPE